MTKADVNRLFRRTLTDIDPEWDTRTALVLTAERVESASQTRGDCIEGVLMLVVRAAHQAGLDMGLNARGLSEKGGAA